MELTAVDLNLLVTLDALLQEGSVTRAAARLHLSTPAVSHALARLRRQLEDPILVRAGRHMVLTARAAELRPRVRALLAEVGAVLGPESVFDPSTAARDFLIHATDHVVTVLGPVLDRLVIREAPHVTLRFLPTALDDAALLREGAIDCAIGVYPQLPPEIRTRRLFRERFVCVVRADHPTVGAKLTLEQFAALEHVQIAPRGRPGGYLDEELGRRGLERRVVRAVPYFLAAMLLVSQSDYVLTVSVRVARLLAPRLQVRILEPPLELEGYELVLIWHPRLDADPAHRWLREAMVRAARALDAEELDGRSTRRGSAR